MDWILSGHGDPASKFKGSACCEKSRCRKKLRWIGLSEYDRNGARKQENEHRLIAPGAIYQGLLEQALLQTDRGGTPVGIEPFNGSERLDDRQRLAQRRFVKTHQAGPALELIDREAGKRFARAAGGQFV